VTPVLWAAVAAVLAAAPGDPCTDYNEEGEPFTVCFDPGRGMAVGTSVTARGDASASSIEPSYTFVVRYRTANPSRSKTKSLWFNAHRFMETRAQPDGPAKSLLVTAYQATLRRHVEEGGFVLIPTADPVRLRFPFDIALDVGLMRYERRVFEGPGYTVEPAHIALLFDPIRSVAGRFRLAVGPSLSDMVRVSPGFVVHEISPLTSGEVDAGFENEDGWWSARFNAVSGWVYIPGQPSRFRTHATASLERVLIAVNNQPVDLALTGFASINDAGVQHRSEWGASIGIAFRPWGH
jgi:hypothetical protein